MKTIFSIAFVLSAATTLSAATVDFTRDVRPILSQYCFKCHGPDDNVRKGGVRFDQRASAVGKAKSGVPAIVPHQPDVSELVKRILSDDPTDVMPPPATKKPLSTAQKDILKRWIAEGAEYKEHWSFVPPVAGPRPTVKDAAWPKNMIDYFTLARMEAVRLKPSATADKYTLIRRVYLDLIGLPPTPQQADAFVNDPAPHAYEKVVDQLLKSPHYGERWARRWLDLARYADTNGYEKDRQRVMWLYRDWVINALNRDLPFDQFTIEQLAGDMLPQATDEQRIATGFHRNTMLNEEGGADPLEFRWHAINDRTATTGTVWMGLTLNCCQCHNHKYDPISHQEYYQLFAFLNNCDEPTVDVPQPAIAAKRAEIEQQAKSLEANLDSQFPVDPKAAKTDSRPLGQQRTAHLRARFNAWLDQERRKAIPWTIAIPTSTKANIPSLTVENDGIVFVSGDKSKRDVYELTFQTPLKKITALRIEVFPDDRLPNRGPGRVSYEGPFGDFFLSELTMTANNQPVKWGTASHSFHDGKNTAAHVVDGNPLTGWSINGGQGKAHAAVFNLATPTNGTFKLDLLFEKYYAAGLGKFRISVTDAEQPAEARGLPANIEALLVKPADKLSDADNEQLRRQFLATAPELKAERDAIQALRNSAPKFPTALVMAERPANYTRTTYIHKRGEFLEPTVAVNPEVPAVLPPLPKDAPRNRLTFARWLVDPKHPLTARVTVNRHWSAFFGRGLVRTTEDFGLQGEVPTHPELLDWLALEFIRQGWSVKQLHKLIVMSATYQQSANVTPELLERDPKNELLARGPRFRLEGELLRDQALKASGLLSPKIGGPSVFPPQPPGVTTEGAYGALAWNVSTGEDRYRRGLYTFAKRTAPYAMFMTFDGPSGEACVARREVSNTPLQALMLLNDAVFVETAQAFGKQLTASKDSTEVKAKQLWRQWVVRPPQADELALIVRFYEQQKTRLVMKPAEAAAIAGQGDGNVVERAAWMLTARAVMNLDEAMTRE